MAKKPSGPKQLDDDAFVAKLEGALRRHKIEIAEIIGQGLIGRTIQSCCKLMNARSELQHSEEWVREHVQLLGMEQYRGNVGGQYSGHIKREEVRQILRKFGKDTPEEYIQEYEAEGYTTVVATMLARSYAAAERATDEGVLQETGVTADAKAKNVVLGDRHDWDVALMRLRRQIRAAATTLDRAKIQYLREESTLTAVCEVHKLWMEQIERLANFHPQTIEEVLDEA